MCLHLAVGNGRLGGNLGVVEHQTDVGSQGIAAGQLCHPGQQEGGGLLA